MTVERNEVANDANADLNADEFNVENFDIGKLDNADGLSSDINMNTLREMGIIKDESSSQDEVDQSEKKEVEKLDEDASLDDIISDLANPKEHDKEIEDKLAKDNEPDDSDDSKQSDKDLEELESIIHKGEEKKLSKSELKEYAQKGFDYTQKTQEISRRNLELEEKIKSLDEREKASFTKQEEERQKFSTDLNEKKQWDFVLTALQKQNPDLYDEIKGFSEELMVNYQNPLVQGLIEKVSSLENRGVEKEDQEIANQYYRELGDLKSSLIPTLEKLGITVDEEKIKDAWIKGAENVKAATYSIYGDQIRKLQESKIKLNTAKRKAAIRKVPTVSNIKGTKKVELSRPKKSSYHDISKRLMGY